MYFSENWNDFLDEQIVVWTSQRKSINLKKKMLYHMAAAALFGYTLMCMLAFKWSFKTVFLL